MLAPGVVEALLAKSGPILGLTALSFMRKEGVKNAKKNMHSRQYHRTKNLYEAKGEPASVAKAMACKAAKIVAEALF